MCSTTVMLRIVEDRFWLSAADSDVPLGQGRLGVLRPRSRSPPACTDAAAGPRSAEIVDVFGERSSTFVTGGCAARSTASSSSRVPVTAPTRLRGAFLGEARGELWRSRDGRQAVRHPPAHPTASAASKAAYSTAPTSPPTRTHSNLVSIDSSHGTRFLRQRRAERWRRGSSTPDRPLPRRPCLAEEQRTAGP